MTVAEICRHNIRNTLLSQVFMGYCFIFKADSSHKPMQKTLFPRAPKACTSHDHKHPSIPKVACRIALTDKICRKSKILSQCSGIYGVEIFY